MSLFDKLENARRVSAINSKQSSRASTPLSISKPVPLIVSEVTTSSPSSTSRTSASLSKPVAIEFMEPTSSQGNINNAAETVELAPSTKKTILTPSSTLKRNLSRLNDIYDKLPQKIILYRHAESAGNCDATTYACTPDHAVRLTQKGHQQAANAGKKLAENLRREADEEGVLPRVFFLCSPYTRTLETMDGLIEALDNSEVIGVKTAVALREQDFGNFQDPDKMKGDQEERTRFGRFYYRFPNGEAGSDVLIRVSVLCEGLVRDMTQGKYTDSTVVIVTHGLTLRIFLMRWFSWSVEQSQNIYNPRNCDPIVIKKMDWETIKMNYETDRAIEIEHLYELSQESRSKLRGLTDDMVSHPFNTGNAESRSVRERWMELRAAEKKAAEFGLAGHGSGRISLEELEEVLRRRGDMTDDEIKALIKEADVDGDGDINYLEFVTILTSKKQEQV